MKKTVQALLLSLLALAMVLVLGATAFADSLELPASLTVIEAEAFCGDTSLDEVIVPNGVTEIQSRAFADTSLRRVVIPSSVTSIAEDAFAGSSPVFYVEDLNSFSGKLDDMGTVYVTGKSTLRQATSFHNTLLIVEEGAEIVCSDSLEGSSLIVRGMLTSNGTLKVDESFSTPGEGVLVVSKSSARMEIPAASYFAGLNIRMNRNATLCLTDLTSYANTTELTVGSFDAEITDGGSHAVFRFAPYEALIYTLYSSSEADVFCSLFDDSGRRLDYDDDSGEGRNFSLSCDLDPDTVYYYDVFFYDRAATGSIPLTMESSRITSQPEDVVTSPGDAVLFSIRAEGDDLRYQWQTQFPGQDDWQDLVAMEEYSDVLSFEAVEAQNGQRFRCAVTDAYGVTENSDAAALYLATRELAFGENTAEISRCGERVAFRFVPRITGRYSLLSTGSDDTYGYLFDSEGLIVEDDDSGSSFNFRINYRLYADTPYYYLVQYYDDDVSGTIQLLFRAEFSKLNISLSPNDVVTAPGEKVYFHVEAEGDELSYRWQVLLPDGDDWDDCDEAGFDTDTILFEALDDYDGRQYRCVVSDNTGTTAVSGAATLFIRRDESVRRALVIGNCHYGLSTLSGCDNDMAAMASLLRGFSDSFYVTELPDATAAQMRSAIASVFANAAEDDVSLFYYSGHGLYDGGNTDEMGSLVGVDAEQKDPNDYLTPSDLASLLSEIPGRVIVVLDSCYSGVTIASRDVNTSLDRANRNLIEAFAGADDKTGARTEELRQSKFVVFTASKPYEESYGVYIDGIYCGAFTHAFVTSCGGDYAAGGRLAYTPADVNGDLGLSPAEIYSSAYALALESEPLQHALYYAAEPNEILFRYDG